MKRHLVAALGLGLTAALGAMSGCGTEAGPPVSEEAAAIAAAAPRPIAPVNMEHDHFFRVHGDIRWCRPMGPCTGHYLSAVNGGHPAGLVASLDFTQSGLDERAIADVEDAPHAELILYGTLLNPTEAGSPRPFIVKAAYRGMPGVAASADEAFYRVEQRSPPVLCFAAPCNNLFAAKLETTDREEITTVNVERAGSQPLVDKAWIANRVALQGALVAGHLRDGAVYPAGTERVLDAGQVYLRLPDVSRCLLQFHVCPACHHAVYTRNANRCAVFAGCVTTQDTCLPAPKPECAPGYVMASWPADNATCYASACDPAFLSD